MIRRRRVLENVGFTIKVALPCQYIANDPNIGVLDYHQVI